MNSSKTRFSDSAVMAATTVGAGIFSLPYVFMRAGFAAGAFYLILLSFIVVSVHILYWEVLKKTGGDLRLLGLARKYLGAGWYAISFGAIIIGLILTLVAYLILGSSFLSLIFPGLSYIEGVLIFWVLSAAPLFFKEKRFVGLEITGIWFIMAAVAFVFIKGFANTGVSFANLPLLVPENFFLPFGAILFSLAGWTAIEPLFDEEKKARVAPLVAAKSLAIGTFAAAILYAAFIGGIFGSVSNITSDTVSGLVASGWSSWAVEIIGVLGIFVNCTSYLPVSIEIRNSLLRDCRWKRSIVLPVVVCAPILLLAAGLNSFLGVLSLAGGVFVSVQYFIILLVGMKVLKPTGAAKAGFVFSSILFALAAVYEIYYFIVG
ncbi:MAG: aromatic amino acid transport family protein [Patescibacteria group bacterium]